jgi:acyl carrier protein phosphodiesterase
MNYLGHALLSFQDPGILVGNMIGDYVKGMKAVSMYPERIQRGILLHRKIDEYTDHHAANMLAKNIFRPDYQLYAGAFVDTLYDHYLANDPQFFVTEAALFEFTQTVYSTINAQLPLLPEKFQQVFPYMQSQNWLYHYRTVKGIQQAYNGLVQRAANIDDSKRAYELTMQHYYELNQRYYEFIDDVVQFVKKELS